MSSLYKTVVKINRKEHENSLYRIKTKIGSIEVYAYNVVEAEDILFNMYSLKAKGAKRQKKDGTFKKLY